MAFNNRILCKDNLFFCINQHFVEQYCLFSYPNNVVLWKKRKHYQGAIATHINAVKPMSGQRYNLMGQPVVKDYKCIVNDDGQKLIVRYNCIDNP